MLKKCDLSVYDRLSTSNNIISKIQSKNSKTPKRGHSFVQKNV